MQKSELFSNGQWELKRQLGSGGFGEVLLWRHRMSGQEIATKRLIRDHRCMAADEIAKLKERWMQEYRWMRALDTKYIVRGVNMKDKGFVEYLNEQHAWSPLPVIVMEYCNGGDLRSHLQQMENLNGLHEYEVREVMRALRHAIEYLHNTCGIEHRDLKPDNVVIHHKSGRERHYKLTDFGLARKQTDQTCVKSIVGTRHYYAPEIVVTAKYTKTVDYWSLGVIAFELMCGVLPFIPHQSLGQIINSIQAKPLQCVAITEDPEQAQHYNYHTEMFAETRMSCVFRQRMTEWLRLTLDVDYRRRGTAPDEVQNNDGSGGTTALKFYSELDAIIASKVLTVFCLNTYRFHAYDVSDPNFSMGALVNAIQHDTGFKELYFVFPLLHPRADLSVHKRPIDLFVEELQDTSDNSNPPVMLYVVGYQCDFNPSNSPAISSVIRWFNSADETTDVPKWLLQQYALHTHFFLSSEQSHLSALLDGLRQYALTIENEVVKMEPSLQELHTEIAITFGRVSQFECMILKAKEVNVQKRPNCGPLFDSWMSRAAFFNEKIKKIDLEIGQSIRKRQASARRRIKEENANNYFEEWSKRDTYAIAAFRQRLQPASQQHSQPHAADSKSYLEYCQDAVVDCINQRNSFLTSAQLKKSRELIEEVHKECVAMQKILQTTFKCLAEFKASLDGANSEFQMHLLDLHMNGYALASNLKMQAHSLKWDGASDMNEDLKTSSLDAIYEFPTEQLIKDAELYMELMSIDADDSMSQIPTTIEFNY